MGDISDPADTFLPRTTPLVEGRLVQRYDRFIADVELAGGEVVRTHCVNTGRMEGLVKPGVPAWISPAPGKKRKLKWTLELLELDGICVGANTLLPNRLAAEVIRRRLVPGLRRWQALETEVAYGENSRIDVLLRSSRRKHLVEVKNCHLVYPDGVAYFPDSHSERATKHLRELMASLDEHTRCSVLFTIQRNDARTVKPSLLHDPTFAEAAFEAAEAGVHFRAVAFEPSPAGFQFLGNIPVNLRRYATEPLQPYFDALKPFSGWRRRGVQQRPKGAAGTDQKSG
ncbi:MAG: DNA/RNA nuclease SfsA [Pseudomonadota bacterium]